ncbi:TnsA endonuclease N-terminal domain-containing protein [Lysinibacillus fusiformis]|nr:TnsA endonuclease N-terminal domain-containing protein [Lysinibacillus fusiformis]
MSISKYTLTEERIEKRYKEGRGSGELSNYIPWIFTHEIPSDGRVHKPLGWKTNRIHHLLSDLELTYFYYLEWSDKVIDIREQFPLERKKTLKIAAEKGIKHPFENKTQTNIVMTTDFLITTMVNNEVIFIARSIKPSTKLEDSGVIDKLEIERQYWEDYNIQWSLIDEKVMSKQFEKNMDYIHEYYNLNDKKDKTICLYFLEYLLKLKYQKFEKTLVECCREFDSLYNLETGSSIYYVRHLYARKLIVPIDMEKPILPFELSLKDINIIEGERGHYGSSIS